MSVFTFGIDLGTTNSCIAVSENAKATVITNLTGKRTTPSYVSFVKDQIVVGEVAKNDIAKNVQNTVFDAKRMIGHKYKESCVQEDLPHWGFKVLEAANGDTSIRVDYMGEDKDMSPQEISSYLLKQLGNDAIQKCLKPADITQNAVITVPAYFNDIQRRATIEAGAKAGMNVLQIINEPTAAAIAYGYKYVTDHSTRTILIYDFGGGTFDVSIIEVKESNIQVKGTDGDTHLGGEDINSLLVKYFAEKIRDETGTDVYSNSKKLQRLRKACDDAKCLLSELNEAEVGFGDLLDNGIDNMLTRPLFENLCQDLFERTIEIVKRTLENSNLSKNSIDDIVLIGGSSRIPKVQALLSAFFNGKPLNKDINPDEAVAIGASILAEDLIRGTTERQFANGAKVLVTADTGEYVGPANTVAPPKNAFPGMTAGPKVVIKQDSGAKVICSDDGGTASAGFRAPISNPRNRKLHIEDVLSHSLGERVVGDRMVFMLKKNIAIPCEYSETFFTLRDDQDKIPLSVYQGEEAVASQNTKLYDGLITGLPRRKAGKVKFSDTFSINANGVLIVSAEETTGALEPFIVTINL